jgi:hypothetical protein
MVILSNLAAVFWLAFLMRHGNGEKNWHRKRENFIYILPVKQARTGKILNKP